MATSLRRFVEAVPSDGVFSLWAGPLHGEPWLTSGAYARHYAASTMKIWVVLAAYRAADAAMLDLDAAVTVTNSFASAAGGGRFSIDPDDDGDTDVWDRVGTDVALRWLAYRALVRSSNLATNLVVETVGLPAVSGAIQASGATESIVARGIEDTEAREAGLQNIVTARDLAVTLQSLAAGTAASAASCQEILAVLAAQQVNDGIPAGLPPGTRVAHKTGEVDGVSHDAGIVYPTDADPYILTLCMTSALPQADRVSLIVEAARASWDDRRVSG